MSRIGFGARGGLHRCQARGCGEIATAGSPFCSERCRLLEQDRQDRYRRLLRHTGEACGSCGASHDVRGEVHLGAVG